MSTLKVDTIESKTINGDITVSSPLVGDGSGLTNLPSQTANDFTNTLKTKLDNVEANATADQTKTDIEALGIDISGTMSGHIIPGTNSVYDIGSAEYKVRHLFLSDNSLWVGDDHKVTVEGGKKKYKKRKKGIVPAGVQTFLITSVFADTAALLINFKAQIHDPAPSNELDPDHADFNPPTSKWQEFLVLHGHPNKLVDDIYNTATDFDDEKEETDKATTEGDIVYFDGSVYKRLPLGAEGQVLLANGDGTAPEWGDNGVGGGIGKNYVINGNFDVWQRGTSFTGQTAKAYFADRWMVSPGLGGTMTVSRQAFTTGQTDVPNDPTYYLSADITTAGSGSGEFHHKIEDVRTLAGKTIVVSFWVKSSGTPTFYSRTHQNFGSGGTGSGHLTHATTTLSTSWQKVTYTTTLGTMSGKTIGANSYLELNWYWANNSTTTADVYIAQVKIEEGSTATSFEPRSYGEELRDCQRYYEEVTQIWRASNELTSGVFNATSYYRVTKRTTPSLTSTTFRTDRTSMNSHGFTVNRLDMNGEQYQPATTAPYVYDGLVKADAEL
jgi:hypothetical protein